MRRLVLVPACGALAIATPASAHVTVTPTLVEPASSTLFVFSAPNEREDAAIRGVTVILPAGVDLQEVEAVPGWRAGVSGRRVTWSGGRIPPGRFVRFSLRAAVSERVGAVSFTAFESFRDGRSPTYEPEVLVAPTSQPPTDSTSGGSLARVALGVAIGAGIVALLAGFLALAVWLRTPRA